MPHLLQRRRSVVQTGVRAGHAASFNGAIPAWLETPSAADLQTTASFAVALWYNIASAPGAYTALLTKGDATTAGDDWGLQITSGNQLNLFFSNGSTYDGKDVGAASFGDWHFVYAGWNDSNASWVFSLDGAAIGTAGGGIIHPQATANACRIGAWGAGNRPLTGAVDVPFFWKRVLLQAEVDALWNGGAGIRAASASGSLLTNLSAGWDLDGPGAGGTWPDAIDAHSLTDHGGVLVVGGKT